MKRWTRLLACVCCTAVFLIFPRASAAGILFTDSGARRIKAILHSPSMAATNIGIRVVALPSGKTIYRENSDKLFMPASTLKLVTAFTALKSLTPQYSFPSVFSTDLFVDSATVHHLCIKGYGDPSITVAAINEQAMTLSRQVKHITGDIVVDSTYFDNLQFGRGWMWDEGIASWNAPVSPYAVNGNCVDIIVTPAARTGETVQVRIIPETSYAVAVASAVTGDQGPITIRREETASGDRFIVSGSIPPASPPRSWRCTVSRPGLFAGTLIKDLLQRYGTTVSGNVVTETAGLSPYVIARFHSRTLADIVRYFLKDSDNLAGECILKAMGATQYVAPGNAEKGLDVVKRCLHDIGIKDASYTLADGSGLSSYNLLSPDIMVRLLQSAYDDLSCFPEFLDALSVAGVDGTMRGRLQQTPMARFVRAKTGTLSGVSCIAGYMQTRKGTMLAFAIMMNGFTGPSQPFTAVQDDVLRTLWELY